jgi:hypothetical protein
MKLPTIFVLILLTSGALAQVPQKISYQAVIRNNDDELIINSQVGMKISILQTSATDSAVYAETHLPTTNGNGLISIEIGNGTLVTGNFDSIDWADGPFFIKTETDLSGGTNYTITGTSQLLSVPYALYAMSAGAVTSTHYVGELYGGGVIFYVDKTGGHGLIVSSQDIGNKSIWSNVQSSAIGSTAQSTWNGKSNTDAIIAQSSHTSSAALLCKNYSGGGFSDWYLPAIDELNKLFNTRYEINKALGTNGIKLDYYYSSTEVDGASAVASYAAGTVNPAIKSGSQNVRAIRAF